MPLPKTARRRVPARARLALTPMIDVVFLLLVFFMVGMKFKELDRQVQAELPKGPPDEPRPALVVREVHIVIRNQATAAAGEPRVLIDGAVMADWDATRARLAHLAELPNGRTDPIILAPHDDALHAWVMHVLDDLHQLRFRDIRFRH